MTTYESKTEQHTQHEPDVTTYEAKSVSRSYEEVQPEVQESTAVETYRSNDGYGSAAGYAVNPDIHLAHHQGVLTPRAELIETTSLQQVSSEPVARHMEVYDKVGALMHSMQLFDQQEAQSRAQLHEEKFKANRIQESLVQYKSETEEIRLLLSEAARRADQYSAMAWAQVFAPLDCPPHAPLCLLWPPLLTVNVAGRADWFDAHAIARGSC